VNKLENHVNKVENHAIKLDNHVSKLDNHVNKLESCEQTTHAKISHLVTGLSTSCQQVWNYTRKNAQVVTSLQTSCYKSVHKLSTSCVRTACSQLLEQSLEQAVNNL
jgi:ferritin-like metal-binding protein YciE